MDQKQTNLQELAWINTHSDYGFEILNQARQNNFTKIRDEHLAVLQQYHEAMEVLQVGGDFIGNGVDGHDSEAVYHAIDAVHRVIAQNSHDTMLVQSQRDVAQWENSSKIGFLLSIEGSSAIDAQFHNLHNYYRLGLRAIALTHNERNQFADGLKIDNPGGLSPLGEEFIRQLNAMDLILDLVHLSPPCFDDVLEIYEKSPIISHATARGVYDCYRGNSDEQIQAIRDRDGFIGVNFLAKFIGPSEERKVTLDDLLDHIDYFVEKASIHQVGIGPDWVYYMEGDWPDLSYAGDINHESQISQFFLGLEARGYSRQEIAHLAKDNYIAYLRRNLPPSP